MSYYVTLVTRSFRHHKISWKLYSHRSSHEKLLYFHFYSIMILWSAKFTNLEKTITCTNVSCVITLNISSKFDTCTSWNHRLLRNYWCWIYILIHYVCNACFHWLWHRKFVALNHSIYALKQRRRHVLSNITKMFKKRVLGEWIRMVIIRFVFEWFAGINCIILRSQIPVLPLRWFLVRILNYQNPIDTRLNDLVTFTVTSKSFLFFPQFWGPWPWEPW